MLWPVRRSYQPARPSLNKGRPRCWPTGFSSYHVCFEVWPQSFGDADAAVRLLMSFNERDEQAGERGAAAVEDVREFVFAGFALETQVHAARLEIFAIRAARNFE